MTNENWVEKGKRIVEEAVWEWLYQEISHVGLTCKKKMLSENDDCSFQLKESRVKIRIYSSNTPTRCPHSLWFRLYSVRCAIIDGAWDTREWNWAGYFWRAAFCGSGRLSWFWAFSADLTDAPCGTWLGTWTSLSIQYFFCLFSSVYFLPSFQ